MKKGKNLKAGLLPLYLKLYDDLIPEMRARIEGFLENIEIELKRRGVNIIRPPVCRVEKEFREAIELFEKEKVDALITLHLAYSPSLESVGALSKTNIPIIVLDTTPEYDFGEKVDPDEILYNHGIHGVQDFCSILKRNGKDFFIEAGHWEKSDVLDNIVKRIKSASIAKYFSNMRVGTIEGSFKGMGDFYIHPGELKDRTGIDTISISAKELAKLLPETGDEAVKNELELDKEEFEVGKLSNKAHIDSIKAGIAVRRWIEINDLTAFTMDFSKIDKHSGLPTLPFLEASKAMLRGIGYAGEGDVVTAALTGALLNQYPDSSFAEMFCPDWKNNRIFLSHMGEINPRVISGKTRLIEKDLLFTNMANPAMAVGQFIKGEAAYVNLIPSKETFTLLISQIELVEVKNSSMADTVNGWFRPPIPVRDFLAGFSHLGGTHHSVVVYGNEIGIICDFGKIMGWKVYEI